MRRLKRFQKVYYIFLKKIRIKLDFINEKKKKR